MRLPGLVVLAVAAQLGAQAAFAQSEFSAPSPIWLREPIGTEPVDRVSDARSFRQLDSGGPPVVERFGIADRISATTRGRVQVEGGYAFVADTAAGTRVTEHTLPDLLIRIGLTQRLELRLGWPGYVSTRYDGPLADYCSSDTLDPNVGFMFDVCRQHGAIPQTAVLAAIPITRRGNPFALASLQPLSRLLYRWYLTDRLAAGGTTGLALFREGNDDFIQFQQSVNLDFLLTDRLSTFVEWQFLADHGSVDDGPQHLLGGGLAWLCTQRLQLGWRAGGGVNRRAPDFLTDVRFAYRF